MCVSFSFFLFVDDLLYLCCVVSFIHEQLVRHYEDLFSIRSYNLPLFACYLVHIDLQDFICQYLLKF